MVDGFKLCGGGLWRSLFGQRSAFNSSPWFLYYSDKRQGAANACTSRKTRLPPHLAPVRTTSAIGIGDDDDEVFMTQWRTHYPLESINCSQQTEIKNQPISISMSSSLGPHSSLEGLTGNADRIRYLVHLNTHPLSRVRLSTSLQKRLSSPVMSNRHIQDQPTFPPTTSATAFAHALASNPLWTF